MRDMTASDTWRLRCLVALWWDAPEAFDAKIMAVPHGRTMEIPRYRPATMEPVDPVRTDRCDIEHLMFRRPPQYAGPGSAFIEARVGYHRDTNRILVKDFKSDRRP